MRLSNCPRPDAHDERDRFADHKMPGADEEICTGDPGR